MTKWPITLWLEEYCLQFEKALDWHNNLNLLSMPSLMNKIFKKVEELETENNINSLLDKFLSLWYSDIILWIEETDDIDEDWEEIVFYFTATCMWVTTKWKTRKEALEKLIKLSSL